ncbi:Transposase [Serratia fonticola]|nr:Transposase [Serratia fonticola]
MGTPRFTPEFKEEAVRQITERGYYVVEVSERLGVSAHSLYKIHGSWDTSGCFKISPASGRLGSARFRAKHHVRIERL